MDLRVLVDRMVQDEQFLTVTNNPLAQFGVPGRTYLGATLLPERLVPENAYVEEGIRYRTIIANDASRYSAVQIKGGVMVGSFQVILGDQDIGSHFTGAQYDALIRLIRRSGGGTPTMVGATQLIDWADRTLNLPLIERIEKQRWEALIDASVIRTGDNNYREVVTYPTPTGHRPVAGGVWSNNSYDPYLDIIAGMEFLAAKGYTVNRIVASTPVVSKLSNNNNIKSRVGRLSVQPSGTIVGLPGRASLTEINQLFSEDGLPPIEKYDLQYRTSLSQGYFLKRDVFAMFATTGNDETIVDSDDNPVVVQNTLGYVGVGRAAGQDNPGRVIPPPRVITDSKPPRIEGEGWQTSLPVVTEPEGIYVITGIT